jgi:hypothetical protein
VSGNLRHKLEVEKRKIEDRLKSAVEYNGGGPVLAASNIHYDVAEKTRAIPHGGIGAIHRLVRRLELPQRIDAELKLLTFHVPYHESDHVLNLAYNVVCGGRTLDDIEQRRQDAVHLDALGARSLPDPTTAGDFCRRFEVDDIEILQRVFNEIRIQVWKGHPTLTQEIARIDADGTLVPTLGECKAGMDITFKGTWGYGPLIVSLANTQEPLFINNRGGNRPSHEGAVETLNKAVSVVREAGFSDVLLRGDTDFSLTSAFDAWTDDGVRFIFGFDANATMKAWAGSAPEAMYRELQRRAEARLGKPRARPENVKEQIVQKRGFKNIKLKSEDIVDFDYQPTKCKKSYRVVAVRKNLEIYQGKDLVDTGIRYFFYITNDFALSQEEVVAEAMGRCNQENLHAQLKAMRSLHAPLNNLLANWAYMVITALAWSLKAWLALTLPVHPRWRARHAEQQRALIRMEFRTFLAAMINIPCQILRSGRRLIYRVLAWNPWLPIFFRFLKAT